MSATEIHHDVNQQFYGPQAPSDPQVRTYGSLADVNKQFYGPQADQNPVSEYLGRLQAARELLLSKGIGARDAVFITAYDGRSPNFAGVERKAGKTFEVFGHFASIRLAHNTHRLATDEEIARYKKEQKNREIQCADEESKRPENQGRALMAQALAQRIAVSQPAPVVPPLATSRVSANDSPFKADNSAFQADNTAMESKAKRKGPEPTT